MCSAIVAGVVEGFLRGFGLERVVVLELPVDAAAVVRAVGDGILKEVRCLVCRDGDLPALRELEAHAFGVTRLVLEVLRIDGAQVLFLALDGVLRNARGGDRGDDGVRSFGGAGVGRVLILAEGVEADGDDGGVRHGGSFIGGGDGDSLVVLADLDLLRGEGEGGDAEGGEEVEAG